MADNISELPKEPSRNTSAGNIDNTAVTTAEQTLAISSVICGPTNNLDNLTKETDELMAEQQLSKLSKIAPAAAEEEEVNGNECNKSCYWGHPCIGKKGEACPPCNVKILLHYEKCGHKLVLPCYIGVKDNFKKNCQKLYPSPWICKCGEKIHLHCFLGNRRLTWQEAMKFCDKCGEDKDFGAVLTYLKKFGSKLQMYSQQ